MITGRLVKNFSLDEMSDHSKGQPQLIITPEVVEFAQMVQELRDWYKHPLKVNSWFRTEFLNNLCDGDPKSLHLDGLAVDIDIYADNKLIQKWQDICKKHNKIGGINRYMSFTHLSIAEQKFGHKKFIVRDERML